MKHYSEVFGALREGAGFSGARGNYVFEVEGKKVGVEIAQFIRGSGKMSKKNIADAKAHIEKYKENYIKWRSIEKGLSKLLHWMLAMSWPGITIESITEHKKNFGEFENQEEAAFLWDYREWVRWNCIENRHYPGKRADILFKKVELAQRAGLAR